VVWSRTTPSWAMPRHSLQKPPKRPRGFAGVPGIIAVVLLFGGAAYLAAKLDPLPPRFSGTAQAADGDSLRLRGDRIRLLGIDAPELDQVCWDAGGAEWSCGRAAHRRLGDLLRQGAADCQPQGQDKYGRTLASCMVGGRDLGAALVLEGMAIAYGRYESEEAVARSVGSGIWRGRFVEPRQWRDDGPSGAPGPSLFELLWDWFRELTGATTLR
jgi:endonuclease YncB( thermonuclease family)